MLATLKMKNVFPKSIAKTFFILHFSFFILHFYFIPSFPKVPPSILFFMFHFRFKFCQICVLCPFASIFLFKKFVIQKIFVLFCDAISRGVTA